jgi:hypothetical protein
MATDKQLSDEEVQAKWEEILGPPPDFSENLEIIDPDPAEHVERARATVPRTYIDRELPAEDDEEAPEGARAIASKTRSKEVAKMKAKKKNA